MLPFLAMFLFEPVLRPVCLLVVLDEDQTHVVFRSGSEDMQVRLLVPKQYSTLKVDFEGADDDSAAVDVDLSNPSAEFWDFDFESDPCNVIVTSSIPVRFRETCFCIPPVYLNNGYDEC